MKYTDLNPDFPVAKAVTDTVQSVPYNDLITSQFRSSTKFNQLVQGLTGAIKSNIDLLDSMPALFDVDTAVGAQLDVVGKWVGVSRGMNPALEDCFFSFGIQEKGFGVGYWKDRFATTGITVLPDGEYRAIIKAKIALNQWAGDMPNAITAVSQALPNNGFFITDNMDMSMTLNITGPITPLVQALVTRGYFDVRPAGVQINYDTSICFFGFGLNTTIVAGFGTGSWGRNVPLL